MEERRRITTVRQLELLVEFLEQHKDLALGRVRSKEGRSLATRLWGEIQQDLNTEGPARTAKEWAKVWNDLKCKVRAKLSSINASQRGTGGGPRSTVTLTELETRIANNILGNDFGPLQNVGQDQFHSTDDVSFPPEQEEISQEDIEVQEIPQPIELNINEESYEQVQEVIENPSPVPSLTGQVPTTPTGPDCSSSTQRRRLHRHHPLVQTSMSTTSRMTSASALDEAKMMVLQIEKYKSEATLKIAQGFHLFAEAIKLIAESIDCFSQQYHQQQDENN